MKNKIRYVTCLVLAFLTVSCVDGYKDDQTFSSGVRDAQLESPDASTIKITSFTNTSGEERLRFEWPVVYGASGYQFSFYNVDDPDHPIAIGDENEFIDGCSVDRLKQEDTNYKVVIKALGNEKFNNKDAVTSTELTYSTLVPIYATIPSGSDLGTYFAANPVAPLEPGVAEIAYELEPGGEYTMSSDVMLGLTTLTIRGNKLDHAKITMTGGSFVSDGAGTKFKFIDFECSGLTTTSVFLFNPTQNPDRLSNTWVTVIEPIAFQSCNVKGLTKYLVWDSNKKYGLKTLLVKDCIVEQNVSSAMQMIYMQGGFIKDAQMMTSTFYNKQINGGYWIQYNGSNRVTTNSEWKNEPYNWVSASLFISNCTFYQIAKTSQMANYSGLAQKGNFLTITKSIFVDCGSKNVIRRFGGGGGNFTRLFGYNSYWFDGAFATEETTTTPKDDSGTHIDSDPSLQDPANGNFTVGGAAHIAARTGDPRWLPEE